MDTDVPSPDNVYSIDLDFNFNFDFNGHFPIWSENDELSKELTNSILSENFSNIDKDQHQIYESVSNEFLVNESTNTAVTSDLIWNAIPNIEQFYYEDIDNPVTVTTNANTSDLFIVEPIVNNNLMIGNEFGTESLTEFDVLKEELFEFDLFSECLKDIDDTAVFSQTATTAEFDAAISTNSDNNNNNNNNNNNSGSVSVGVTAPIVDWNRRRSLLYDKNEFVRTTQDTRASCRRYQDVMSRIKSPICSSVSTRCSSGIRNSVVEPRTYKCSVRDCEKTYCKASHLKSHMRRHSGVKPFACDWNGCNWRFSRSDELARHKRSHSGIKPYSCDLCEKAFSRSDHLSKHAKVHMKKMALYGTPIITKKCNYKYLSINRLSVE